MTDHNSRSPVGPGDHSRRDFLRGSGIAAASAVLTAQATAALADVPHDRFIADVNSGMEELRNRVPGGKIAIVGFCFGGGLVWQLLASGAPHVSAAVPFYGPLPDNPDFGGSKRAAVLAIYAALDRVFPRLAGPTTTPVETIVLQKVGD